MHAGFIQLHRNANNVTDWLCALNLDVIATLWSCKLGHAATYRMLFNRVYIRSYIEEVVGLW